MEDYFVGTVIDVLSPGVALIRVLQTGENGSCRWHTVVDGAEVDCRFVFSSDFDMLWCDIGNPSATQRTVAQTVAEAHPGVSSRHLV